MVLVDEELLNIGVADEIGVGEVKELIEPGREVLERVRRVTEILAVGSKSAI
jgi:hypothetical protein